MAIWDVRIAVRLAIVLSHAWVDTVPLSFVTVTFVSILICPISRPHQPLLREIHFPEIGGRIERHVEVGFLRQPLQLPCLGKPRLRMTRYLSDHIGRCELGD